MDTSFKIKVVRKDIDISLIRDEIDNDQHDHLWEQMGDSFRGSNTFQYTKILRLFGPEEMTRLEPSKRPSIALSIHEAKFKNKGHFKDVHHQLVCDLCPNVFSNTKKWLLENTFIDPSLKLRRAGFMKLDPLQGVPPHKDEGVYFDHVIRYHLGIKGRYQYNVDNKRLIVDPGTLFCFNNHLLHSTQNLTEEERITLIFDVFKPL